MFQNGGAKDGLDMNVGPAWAKGYTGKGVVVSILDDGIQTNHPDLAQNYVSIWENLQRTWSSPLARVGSSIIYGTGC